MNIFLVLHLRIVLLFLINLIEKYKIKCLPRGLNPKLLHQSLDLTTEMVFYKLKNFSLSPGIEHDSSSPESLSYTTRPSSHNSTSDYVVYDAASAGFDVKF